jgi:hypothetical protein
LPLPLLSLSRHCLQPFGDELAAKLLPLLSLFLILAISSRRKSRGSSGKYLAEAFQLMQQYYRRCCPCLLHRMHNAQSNGAALAFIVYQLLMVLSWIAAAFAIPMRSCCTNIIIR